MDFILPMTSAAVCTVRSRSDVERLVARFATADIRKVFVMVHPTSPDGTVEPIPGLQAVSMPPARHRVRRAARGAAAGAVIGGAVGATGLFVPFVWPMLLVMAPVAVVAGAAAGAIVEAAADATTPMGEIETLEDFKISDAHLREYREALERGGYFVAVRSGDRDVLRRALEIYQAEAAENARIFTPGEPAM